MISLPTFTTEEDPYMWVEKTTYEYPSTEFIKEFGLFLKSSCWALTADDELIFNTLDQKGIKDRVQDFVIRKTIIDDPHNALFANLFKVRVVNLYMIGLEYGFRVEFTFSMGQSKVNIRVFR